jgi:phospholipase C
VSRAVREEAVPGGAGTARRALCALGACLLALAVAPAGARAARSADTPIKHFVSLMQQNRSFDHYFGTYPGADGIPEGACMPVDPTRRGSRCIKPFHLGDRSVRDLPHSRGTFAAQYRRGRMNGFVDPVKRARGRIDRTVMGHYDGREVPYYWNVADDYVLFDRFFASSPSGSVRNAMFWVSGTPGNFSGQAIPDSGFGDLPTIFDRLEASGVSWKFYVQDYNRAINYRNRGSGERSSQVMWVPLLGFDRFIGNRKLSRHIVDLEEYYEDLEHGTLPAVSYIVAPARGSSEHPPGSVRSGQRFVAKLVNALMRSSAWTSSAFMLTYDGWGGLYDHVRPPRVDRYGYGFRVPALLVSPYAREGYVDSTTLDFTSILKFIERNWDVPSLASRDRRANTFAKAFDFTQAPREPQFLSGERNVAEQRKPNRIAIYGLYMAAVVLTFLMVAWGVLGRSPFAWAAETRRRMRGGE